MFAKFNLRLLLGLALIGSSPAARAAQAPSQLPVQVQPQGQAQVPVWLRQRLRQVQQQSYPELEFVELRMGSFSEPGSLFQSNFEPMSLLGPKPVYVIELNPHERPLAACPPEALDAVLAHELAHTLDYHRGGRGGLLLILAQLLIDPAAYERRTDLQAVFRGYGPGLISYRRWSEAYLSPEQAARKRRVYLTASELAILAETLARLDFAARQRLEARLLAQPPLDEAALKASLQAFGAEMARHPG